MRATLVRLSALASTLALLSGCGSGGNASSSGGNGSVNTPTAVTVTFSGATPTAVATQIGSGSYTAVTPASTITFTLPSGTTNYAVAYVCPEQFFDPEILTVEYVMLASTQDGTLVSAGCTPEASVNGLATLQVDASAISGAAFVKVGGNTLAWSGSTVSFSGWIADGTQDVPVYALDINGTVLAVRILRSQTIPGALNGGNPVVFNASDETALASIAYNNLPSGYTAPSTSVVYNDPDGYLSISLGNHVSTQYRAMPSGAFQSGGYYKFTVGANSSTANNYVGVFQNTTIGGSQVFNLPAPWSFAGPTAAALPTFNFNYAGFSGMSNVFNVAEMDWDVQVPPSGNDYTNEIMIEESLNYQGGATSFSVPGLSGVSGFISPAPSGTSVNWRASIYQGLDIYSAFTPTSGTWPTVQVYGSYTEP